MSDRWQRQGTASAHMGTQAPDQVPDGGLEFRGLQVIGIAAEGQISPAGVR